MAEEQIGQKAPIEKLITLPQDVEKAIAGKKTTTRRNGRHAEPGDHMVLNGVKFEITKVYEQSLGELTDADARTEGFDNVEGYKQSILAMHPGMPWLPQMKVWVHEFRKI